MSADTAWEYKTHSADTDGVASARTVWLSDSRPSDLDVGIPTESAQYADLRYGSSDSRRVALVLTRDAKGEQQLYLDRDRNRRITFDDRLHGVDSQWQFPLDAEFVTPTPDDPVAEVRQVLLRSGAVGRTLTLMTLGFLEGRLQLDAGDVPAGAHVVYPRREARRPPIPFLSG